MSQIDGDERQDARRDEGEDAGGEREERPSRAIEGEAVAVERADGEREHGDQGKHHEQRVERAP